MTPAPTDSIRSEDSPFSFAESVGTAFESTSSVFDCNERKKLRNKLRLEL